MADFPIEGTRLPPEEPGGPAHHTLDVNEEIDDQRIKPPRVQNTQKTARESLEALLPWHVLSPVVLEVQHVRLVHNLEPVVPRRVTEKERNIRPL